MSVAVDVVVVVVAAVVVGVVVVGDIAVVVVVAVVDAVVVAADVVAAVVGVAVVVAAAAVNVVVGSDIDVNARRPTWRLYWILQHILHSKCLSHRCGRCFVRTFPDVRKGGGGGVFS